MVNSELRILFLDAHTLYTLPNIPTFGGPGKVDMALYLKYVCLHHDPKGTTTCCIT